MSMYLASGKCFDFDCNPEPSPVHDKLSLSTTSFFLPLWSLKLKITCTASGFSVHYGARMAEHADSESRSKVSQIVVTAEHN